MKNLEIADIFDEMGELLEIQKENPFRIRAYYKAALNLRNLTDDLDKLVEENRLRDIPGIGEDLAGKIKEYIETGKVKAYEKLRKSIPQGVLEMMSIPGVGPKTAKLLFDKLNIRTITQLKRAAERGKISKLPGMKEKTEENILKGIGIIQRTEERMMLSEALSASETIMDYMKKKARVKDIAACGSLRRMKETVRDIDILVTSSNPRSVMDAFVRFPETEKVLAHGDTKSSILTKGRIQADCRVLEPSSFGAALVYFTGSKQHNIKIRGLAKDKGLKINEYGVFRQKSNKKIAGKTEEEVYKALGLEWIPPELREDQGEVEAAAKGNLPELLELKDIKGDLHLHSNHTDGSQSIEEMARAAQRRGYKYILITDHTRSLPVAGGLSEKGLLREVDEIRRLNKKLKAFRILAGCELEIKTEGTLDYPDSVLKELDMVVAAIHFGFKQSKEKLTERIIRAMENRYVNIIAHPTGRLMGTRDAYELDFDEVFKVAKETNTALEINAYPARLDLTDINTRRAKDAGVPLVISTDAHILAQLDNMRFGVAVARRAWCEKKDILNTLPLGKLLKKIRK